VKTPTIEECIGSRENKQLLHFHFFSTAPYMRATELYANERKKALSLSLVLTKVQQMKQAAEKKSFSQCVK
jgi:hypothetical protein